MRIGLLAVAGSALIGSGVAMAEPTRVIVSIENLAPVNGTAQTPHWVGFHDGATFDIYNGGTPANTLPIAGSVAVERLAEDGNTAPIINDFATLMPEGEDGVLAGPNGALLPGETTSGSFILDSTSPYHRFFSYASMVLPSNDFWYANGNPLTHPVFDENGNFVAEDFFVTRDDVLDAGTEVNTEEPSETAFFGQTTANTGSDENSVILDFDPLDPLTFFKRPGSGGILDSAQFRMADFLTDGYPLLKFSFSDAPAIVERLKFKSALSGDAQVPPVETKSKGIALAWLLDEGTRLYYKVAHSIPRRQIQAAHLHLGNAGENGPVVAILFDTEGDTGRTDSARPIRGQLDLNDLTGPLAGQPLDALVAHIQGGNVYVNVHTKRYPDGEVRGQLELKE